MNHRLIFSLTLLFAALIAIESSGCTCSTEAGKFNASVRFSDLIFSGRLVRIRSASQKQTRSTKAYQTDHYVFLPTKIWRGTVIDTIRLEPDIFCGGPNLIVGNYYVVFASLSRNYDSRTRYSLSVCDRFVTGKVDTEVARLNRRFKNQKVK